MRTEKVIGFLCVESCTLDATNFSDGEIIEFPQETDNYWKGTIFYESYPQIFKPIYTVKYKDGEEVNTARDEYRDIILGLAEKHIEAADEATEKEIEERLLSITFDRIKVLEEALERIEATAKMAQRV